MRDRWTRGRYGRFERTTDSHLPSDAACRSCPHVIVTRVLRPGGVRSVAVTLAVAVVMTAGCLPHQKHAVDAPEVNPAANKGRQAGRRKRRSTQNTSHS